MSEKDLINKVDNEFRWYIVQAYSGSENVVKADIETRIISLGMQDLIKRVIVPEEIKIQKNAKGIEKEVTTKLYPGYIFIEMNMTDESWFVVRNTPRVTGLLGSSGGGTKPIPLTEGEITPILKKIGLIKKVTFEHLLGQEVEVIDGPFIGQIGYVSDFDDEKEIVTVGIDIFGRDIPTEVNALWVKIRD